MYKEQECGQCGKMFVTTWRLRKHLRIHTQKFTKVCHFFKTGKPCPFEELGCKFLHSTAQKLTVESENETVKDTLCDSVHIENIDSESITDEKKNPIKRILLFTPRHQKNGSLNAHHVREYLKRVNVTNAL